MKAKTKVLGVCALVVGSAVADVEWKYDTSGREGKYAAVSSVTVSHGAAYDGRPSVFASSPAAATATGCFDTRTVFDALKTGLNLNFNAPGFMLIFR